MLDFIQKILDATASDRRFSIKIPTILATIGALLLFISEKLPQDLAQRGLIQILAVLVIIVAVVLLLFSVISETFNIPLLPAFSDGVLSGLLATFVVASAFFAPILDESEENLYIYRISITLSYGMLYGGVLGVFTAFFDKKSSFNVSKHSTVLIVALILIIYGTSNVIFPTMPAVPTDPMSARDVFLIHALFVPTFTLMYFKTTHLRNVWRAAALYAVSTAVLWLVLLVVKQAVFYPSSFGLDNESLMTMTFYTNERASIYAFATMMVVFSVYASINIIYSFRTIDLSGGRSSSEPEDSSPAI